MELGLDLVEGRFLERLNRFSSLVEVAGEEVQCHVANSGRMRELLVPGYRVLLKPHSGKHRKTQFDLALVDLWSSLCSADARLPNALVAEALDLGSLRQFHEYPRVRREVTFGESRLDLLLEGPKGCCYIETKSVTLVIDGVGLFPDAPTIRGAKHMGTLAQAVAAGHRAAAIFVVQRDDATAFATNDDADPDFGVAFREALAAGVEAFAYNCRVSERAIDLSCRLPIQL